VLDVTYMPTLSFDSPASLCPESARSQHAPVSLTIAALEPEERLETDTSSDATIAVIEGVFYAVVGDDDQVLTPGDQIQIPAGESRSVWNAGDETARAITGCTATH
jgi:quercetin dioxygenase-like cupin family protein